jgi:predicted TIM-barrel fold metal-dependent hydrolase
MRDPSDAVEEIGHALDVLKLDGVCLMSSYGENYLGDRLFDPVLEALNRRVAVVFVHPFYAAQLPGASRGQEKNLPCPAFMIEYPFDTTRFAMHLMFSGALERYPRVRFILSHTGGTLPYLAWRMYFSQMVSPQVPNWSYEKIREALRHFWYDTAMAAGPEMLACFLSVIGADRLVFGSDWPLVNDKGVAACVNNLSDPDILSESQRLAIARGNALALFPRLAK